MSYRRLHYDNDTFFSVRIFQNHSNIRRVNVWMNQTHMLIYRPTNPHQAMPLTHYSIKTNSWQFSSKLNRVEIRAKDERVNQRIGVGPLILKFKKYVILRSCQVKKSVVKTLRPGGSHMSLKSACEISAKWVIFLFRLQCVISDNWKRWQQYFVNFIFWNNVFGMSTRYVGSCYLDEYVKYMFGNYIVEACFSNWGWYNYTTNVIVW